MRKPRTIKIATNFRRGDVVALTNHPWWSGVVESIEINVRFSDEPRLSYCIRTNTPERVRRYVNEDGLRMLRERKEQP